MSRTIQILVLLAAIGTIASTPRPMSASTLERPTVQIQKRVEVRSITGQSSLGNEIRLEATSRPIHLVSSAGSRQEIRLICLFHAESQLLWWTYEWLDQAGRPDHLTDFAQRFEIMVTDNEIMAMELLAPPVSIWWLRSTERASSIEEGERSAMQLIERAVDSEESLPIVRLHQINLTGQLPADFSQTPGRALAPLGARILSAEPVEEGWSITLAGRNERRALVLLDQELAVASAREYRP